MSFRKLSFPIISVALSLIAVLCYGQATWQTVTNLPGVDWKNLVGPKKQAALRSMQAEGCSCGCDMKIAECRVKDPSCGVSRKLAGVVVKAVGDGKDAAGVKAEVLRVANEPPPVLDDAVKISEGQAPTLGPKTARLTIVEFSDFQCPYCAKAIPQIKEVMRQLPKDVRLVFKQFPLDSHSEAQFAAEAALAAQAQGKFWEMHDLLYGGFPELDRNRVLGYAKRLNLDMARFTSEVDSHKYAARVKAEEQEGEVAGVTGTPSFFLNGKHYNGAADAAQLVALIRQELK